MSKLPGQVASRTPAYLGLFRKGERGLSWPRALKIAAELRQLVSAGTVRWEGGEERPAPPDLWAEALDKVLARRPDALDNHNYLRRIVWEDAKPLAAQAECRDERDAGRRYFEPDPASPRKRSCWTCVSKVKSPKNCARGQKPVGGNDHLGCGAWEEKASSVGELAGNLLPGLSGKGADG
ncbi:MAG: hypothetical protein ABFD98_15715 [Syntrophobacteraceae bacterium]|nr:hypothetical protein [Desulfobacteraceae bacterium]